MDNRINRLKGTIRKLRRQLKDERRSIREIIECDNRRMEELRRQLSEAASSSNDTIDKMIEQIHASAVLIREQSSRELRLTAELCCKGK